MERFDFRFRSAQGVYSGTSSSYVYYTQIMQAETLATAYRLWRRNWAGPGKEYTAGALVWQVEHCCLASFSLGNLGFLVIDQRLLARDLLVNSRLLSPTKARILCHRTRAPSVHGGDDTQRS